jgi:hypothetical protein
MLFVRSLPLDTLEQVRDALQHAIELEHGNDIAH